MAVPANTAPTATGTYVTSPKPVTIEKVGTGSEVGAVNTSKDPLAALTGDQRDAYIALQGTLDQYGLSSLSSVILGYVKQGYDATTVSYLLQQTPEYKARFAGNDARKANGFAVLSPAEYLATERAYKDAAAAYGLPSTFYDNPDDFAALIGKDISPQEFSTRASYAFKYTASLDPSARQALQQYYGVDDSHIAAYFLDPTKGQAILDRQAQAVDIGAAAFRQGVGGVDRSQAEGYADLGVTGAQAQQGFAQSAEAIDEGQLDIASRFNSDLSTKDINDDFVGGLESAKRKRALLNQSEDALFSQGTGAGAKSFGNDSSGSY